MKRGTELKRRTPLLAKAKAWWEKIRSPLPKFNQERRRRRREADEVYGSYWKHVCTLPCAVMGEDECLGSVTGHHLKTVAAGGVDAGNLSPLCKKHHRMIHDIGLRLFDARFFNSLPLHALGIWDDYQRSLDEESQ